MGGRTSPARRRRAGKYTSHIHTLPLPASMSWHCCPKTCEKVTGLGVTSMARVGSSASVMGTARGRGGTPGPAVLGAGAACARPRDRRCCSVPPPSVPPSARCDAMRCDAGGSGLRRAVNPYPPTAGIAPALPLPTAPGDGTDGELRGNHEWVRTASAVFMLKAPSAEGKDADWELSLGRKGPRAPGK